MSARVLAIANQKGGVGKTTTTLSLSAALALQHKRVLVMDLDPHACASVHMRYYPEALSHSAYDIFQTGEDDWAAMWEAIRYTREDMLFDFVPSSIRLSELEVDLRERGNKGVILKRSLELVADGYDFIVLDCPPHIGVLLVNALVASDLLIIPIQTDFLALHGLRLLFDSVRMINRVVPRPISYRALATMYDRRASACRRVLELLQQKLGDKMFEAVIDMDTKFREASAQGKVIYDIAPDCRGAREYAELANEILTL
ncbi:MAG: ParA family protein [Desulfovibrionaceae bacterium]